MNVRIRIVVTCLLSALAFQTQRTAMAGKQGSSPKAVALAYLDTKFTQADEEPGYWKARWNINFQPERRSVRLGRPFSHYRLDVDELERFVESGDLLGSASRSTVDYPIFADTRFMGTVQLVETGGNWAAVSYATGSLIDSLAAARGESGDSVAVVGGRGIGGLMLTLSPHGMTRVHPLGLTPSLVKLDSDGAVSYKTACDALRPQAEAWLTKYRRREKDVQKQ